VVPFGANLDCNRTSGDIRALVGARSRTTCRLLFVGVDWRRKGGDVAVDIVRRLNERGVPAEIHVAGCTPPEELPDFVRVHGFISKTSGEGRRRLDDLFSAAHFLILPTRADCTPVVFPEACSFGLPVLTTDVGGIRTVIRNGRNGYALTSDAPPDAYCEVIERLWSSRGDYEQLALSAFAEYSERLNWDVAGRRVSELIHKYCG
jgi:glycosyltransferase involved in cell wall biosynthesis